VPTRLVKRVLFTALRIAATASPKRWCSSATTSSRQRAVAFANAFVSKNAVDAKRFARFADAEERKAPNASSIFSNRHFTHASRTSSTPAATVDARLRQRKKTVACRTRSLSRLLASAASRAARRRETRRRQSEKARVKARRARHASANAHHARSRRDASVFFRHRRNASFERFAYAKKNADSFFSAASSATARHTRHAPVAPRLVARAAADAVAASTARRATTRPSHVSNAIALRAALRVRSRNTSSRQARSDSFRRLKRLCFADTRARRMDRHRARQRRNVFLTASRGNGSASSATFRSSIED